jgi:hypothetical protein
MDLLMVGGILMDGIPWDSRAKSMIVGLPMVSEGG